jgi:hypothetical protein
VLHWLVVMGMAAGIDQQSVNACAAVDDDRQRLACYDQLFRPAHAPSENATADAISPPATGPSRADEVAPAGVADAAVSAPPRAAVANAPAPAPQVSAPPAAPASPAEKFGLSAEQIESRRPQVAVEVKSIESIESRVVAVRGLPRDRFVLTLENGQVWEQTEPTPRQRFYAGDAITIRKAAMGSFLASGPHSGERIRVKRQN